MESIEFDIGHAYAGSSKVPPLETCFETKWQDYARGLADLKLPPPWLGRFLEVVCAPPCSPRSEALAGWRWILPCLKKEEDWRLPLACWNETEKALLHPLRGPVLLRGFEALHRECPQHVADWLRLSPHNLCRSARQLGRLSREKARAVLEKARNHPSWHPLDRPYRFQKVFHRWGPLRVPQWMSEALERSGDEDLATEFQKRQPLLQLDLLHRLMRPD